MQKQTVGVTPLMAESVVRAEIYALHDGGNQNGRLVIAYYEKYLEACKTRGISTGTASAEARLDQTKECKTETTQAQSTRRWR